MASHRAILPLDALPQPRSALSLPISLTLAGEEAEHLVVVRRAEVGEAVELIDGQGLLAQGIITAMLRSKKAPSITIDLTHLTKLPPPACQITIWSAIPKGDRSSTMIDMLAQIGAHAWAPLTTTRGVVEASDHKATRLHRVAAEASKQSGRPWHLQIQSHAGLQSIAAWKAPRPHAQVFIADASGLSLPPAAPSSNPKEALILIGPEGGFTPEELQTAQSMGAVPLALGDHILRIETAAIASTIKLLTCWQA